MTAAHCDLRLTPSSQLMVLTVVAVEIPGPDCRAYILDF